MTYTKDNLRQIFQQPFNMNEWQQMLRHYFQATELRSEPERIDGTTEDEQGYYLGAIDTTDSYRIGLFYYQIQHGNVARKRVGLRNLVKSFVNPNWGEFDAALVVFDSDSAKIVSSKFVNSKSLWRLSFVSDIKGESTAPKRYTYVFGEANSYYNTPVGRFDALQRKGISFENIKEAFSVEALSKEFFDEYREHYADIVEYITGKRYVKEKGKWVEKTIHEPCHEILDQFISVYKDPEKTVRDYIKKLMGRLVFLQFLQKKEWMGVPADHQDWKGGDTRFLQNKFNEFADKDNFIDGFLEPLFNDLNTNRQESGDLASPKVGNGIKIPFLNGGLFQLDQEDCSSIRLPQHLLGDVLDSFERYNFTIDENDPNDAQVGVDPEMLGRVFENLLEDNKDKGAFYTPKEIVQYMCQESLIAYLQTGVEDETIKESIRQFVLTHESEHLGSMAEDISIKLLNVKICDPAIGSGAFPMGLLRQLYLCQCAIHPELEEKNAADIKRHIIQNNIYGVDIEKGAVDIARLRFWLSLIVDEETPRFLPNLDFKIMQDNSLLEQYKGADLSKMTELKAEKQENTQLTLFEDTLDVLRLDLRKKLDEYYNCSNHQRKEQLKQEIIDNVKQQLREQSINVDFGDLDLSANDQFTLWHTWFYDVFSQGGFDIVIGNPPYFVYEGNNKEELPILRKQKELKIAFGGKLNAYKIFLASSLNKLVKNNGLNCFIFQNSFMADLQAVNLRKFVLNNCQILIIDSFPERDNKKKRVFESVKMSVCILLVRNTNLNKSFVVNIWDDKDKTSGILTHFTKDEISEIDPISLTIPRLREEAKPIVLKMIKQRTITIKCCEGELNVTSHRPFFSDNPSLPVIMKGAGIQKFYYTFDMSQGQIEHLKENEYLKKCGNSEKAHHHETERIVMQGMTGANDKIRLVMAIVPRGMYLGHSCKYILPSEDVSMNCLLGFMNSKLANFFFRCFSTNSNVNGYEIEAIPICNIPKDIAGKIEDSVTSIMLSKEKSHSTNTEKEETVIDHLVYHLYGLTYDEVLIVDPETPFTREEYEKRSYL